MQAFAWWLIPITATLLAVLWVTWVNRPRRPADAHQTLAAHQRFTEALERSERPATVQPEVVPDFSAGEPPALRPDR